MPSFFKNSFLQVFLLGALMVLAMPPFYIAPLFWLCLPVFLRLLDEQTSLWRSFWLGWLFALGFFVFGLYWISVALTVDIAKFWWLMPFALFGLPSYFSIFWGLAAVAIKYISRKTKPQHQYIVLTILCPLFLCAAEFARGHVLTGFPWNLPGYTWVGWLPVLQSVSVIGIYGLTCLTLLAACLPYLFLVLSKRNAALVNACAIGVFVLIAFWGWQRLQNNPTQYYADYKLRLVQPNIPQGEKWDDEHRVHNFNNLVRLSTENRDADVTHIIWPETAVPFIIQENSNVRSALRSIIPKDGLLMTGALRREWKDPSSYKLYNSLQAVDDKGEIIGSYDKSHLVPFGEYMPLRNIIPLPAVAAQFSDLGEGNGAETFSWGNLPPLGALICYEVIFPGDVANKTNKPEWLLNITNDGWYGNTTGPHQHLAMTISRAVEEGLPIVRVANTGITAVIDPAGRVIVQTKIGAQTFIDSELPKPLR